LDAQVKDAALRSIEMLDQTMQKVIEVREQMIDHGSPKPGSSSSASDTTVAGRSSTDQHLASVPEAPHPGARKPIASKQLEAAITEAVKDNAPGCENFVGVIVQRTAPKSPSDPNWSIKGVRFGVVNREEAGKALSIVVARMQQEFSLSED
jgi:hypothetical protein